jgi:hypothetical protein
MTLVAISHRQIEMMHACNNLISVNSVAAPLTFCEGGILSLRGEFLDKLSPDICSITVCHPAE